MRRASPFPPKVYLLDCAPTYEPRFLQVLCMTVATQATIDIESHAGPGLSGAEREALKSRIRQLLKREDAVMVAHYYTDPLLQELAEETGGCVSDSLEMARFGRDHAAKTL